jgi:hypothetical protein
MRDIRKLQESNLAKLRNPLINSGSDGTRTRDPRRDRPVRALASMSEEE